MGRRTGGATAHLQARRPALSISLKTGMNDDDAEGVVADHHCHSQDCPLCFSTRMAHFLENTMRNSLLHYSLLAAALMSVSTSAFAAENSEDTASDLDKVTVTATRHALSAAESTFPVDIIDRDAIERSQAHSVTDLLRGRVGIDISQQGGTGKLTSYFLRGTESDHVLVLVDGMRLGSATAGMPMLQDIPVDQIERIEIVRGPRSSVYGSEAIGGVIQIFTRKPQQGFTPTIMLGAGSRGYREGSIGFSGRNASAWYTLQLGHQRTDGFNACNGSATLFAGCFADEPDRDGYENTSLNLRGGLTLNEHWTVEANALQADAVNEYDGSPFGGNVAENTQRILSTKAIWTPAAHSALTLQIGRADDESNLLFDDHLAPVKVDAGFVNTRRDSATLQYDLTLAPQHVVTVGTDWYIDRVSSNTVYDRNTRRNLAFYTGYQGTFGTQRIQASVRNDDNKQFGDKLTGSLGWGMQIGKVTNLNVSYATGYKAPTFNDLYYPMFGNPSLQPESSRTLNVGINQNFKNADWSFNVFQTDLDDLIGYDASFMLSNIDKSRIRGAEATGNLQIGDFGLHSQYSYLDPENKTAGINNGNLLPRRASHIGFVAADYRIAKLLTTLKVSGASHRYDDAANQVRLGGYSVTDLLFDYQLSNAWTLQAQVTNLFDRDYETIRWYNQPGREFSVRVRYSPKD